MHPSDEELIQKAKGRDKQAFTVLMDRYSDRICGYLYRYVRDRQIAEDLTVETFLNAYNRLDTYEEMGKFSSWIYMIATNCAKKELQRRKRRGEVSLNKPVDEAGELSLEDLIVDERSRPDYTAREAELKEFIYKAMSEMDDKYKDILMLCDVEGHSNQEVAKILKANPITIGTRLRRARRMLYDILKRYGYDFDFGG